MYVKFTKQYAGREVGQTANLDASLALMLVRDGVAEKVDAVTPLKPKEVKPVEVKADRKPAKPRKAKR
jgi:endonuclease YncB( thermonuclease family)